MGTLLLLYIRRLGPFLRVQILIDFFFETGVRKMIIIFFILFYFFIFFLWGGNDMYFGELFLNILGPFLNQDTE